MKYFLTIAFVVLSFQLTHAQEAKGKYVLMVSLDGFRWDYPDMYDTPFLDSLAKTGVKAKSLQPSYPSKTFPNHYTMATGLYPDHHGIVNNSFYDPETKREYAILKRNAVKDGSFYGGEPMWVTAEKQGVKAATYFWVGSEAAVQGVKPSITKYYDASHTYSSRIDSVMKWYSKPYKERPGLVMLYFDEPDASGHKYGPAHAETGKVVQRLDSLMGVLFTKSSKLIIRDSLNIIITSDHGMAALSEEKQIILKNHIHDSLLVRIEGSNPVYNLEAKDGYLDLVYEKLSVIEHLHVWKSNEIPEKLHYGTNPRTLDINIVAKKGWSVFTEKPSGYYAGTHGYMPQNPSMHAIFYAAGPSFLSDKEIDTFENVDLYNLVCFLLDLEPAKNDGAFERIEPMLLKSKPIE
ncbi:MAG: ectonucleotide pyrophosphatase/phosphodiesterase [Bacteroidota bacterium]